MIAKPLKKAYVIVLLIAVVFNFILSTHFITLLFMGVVFKVFLEVIEQEEYYSLFLVIATFLCIEVAQGFYLFSLTLTSIGLYYFVLAKIKHLLSSPILAEFVYILLFYIIVFVVHSFQYGVEIEHIMIFLFNLFIDVVVIGLFL